MQIIRVRKCALDALQQFIKTVFIMKHMYEINGPIPIIAKTRFAKDVGKRKETDNAEFGRIPCLIKRSAHQNKCMTNNMARQREQSQDKPA